MSFEIFPPKKDSELKNIDKTLAVLCELNPDYISVTFGAGGGANRNRTIELAKRIKQEYHVEPVVHLTCLHYDKAEIDEFARVLANAGLQNVLALRGDKNPDMREKESFCHASDLITYLKGKWDFCFLGACYHAFFRFQEACRIADIQAPIIPGIMPVINAAQIKRMITMCGATFPVQFQKIIQKYESNKEALFDAGMSYALSQIIDLLVSDVEGIHLYTMNNPLVARRICEGIRNIV